MSPILVDEYPLCVSVSGGEGRGGGCAFPSVALWCRSGVLMKGGCCDSRCACARCTGPPVHALHLHTHLPRNAHFVRGLHRRLFLGMCVCVCLCVFVRFCVAVCWLLQCMVLLDGAFLLCLCVLCVCLCLFAWQCSVSCSMDKLDFIAMGTSNSHVEKTWEESACHAPLPPFGSLSFDLARLFVRRVQG